MMTVPAGKMYRPSGIAITQNTGSVFIAEQFNHRISKWDNSGGLTYSLDTSWGSNGDGTSGGAGPIGDGGPTDNSLYRPSGLAVHDNDRLYVTDTFHNRVRILDLITGDFISSIGVGGKALDEFYHPSGMAVNVASAIMVIADELNHRAIRYEVIGDGSLINPSILADPSTGGGQSFIRPHGVFFDNSGLFNVTDSKRGIISRYLENGTFSNQVGKPGTQSTDLFYPSSGIGILTGVATNVNVFADTRNSNLKTLQSSILNLESVTGTVPGTADGQLYWPESSLASNVGGSSPQVLAVNTLNNRVEVFTNNLHALTFQNNFGSP